MPLSPERLKATRWTARILALAVLLFGLPFYFGYGNPLPFISPGYSLVDNVWLSIFPLMFLGLALGWFREKAGGYLIVIPVGAGLVLGLVVHRELVVPMLVPLLAGVLFLAAGHGKRNSG